MKLPPVTDLGSTDALVIDALERPDFVVVAGGSLYSGDSNGEMGIYDPSGKRVATLPIPGGACSGMDVGFGAVWAATCEADPGLVRVDVATRAVLSVPVGGGLPDSEASIGAGEGGLWMVRQASTVELIKVDPVTNQVVLHVPVPGGAKAVRAGLGGVWVSSPMANTISRMDPATGSLVASIKVGAVPQFLAVGEGAVWTMDQIGGTVSRIDPATNSVSATIALGERVRGGDITTGGGYVWLRGSQTLLFQIDPATNTIVKRYGPVAGSGSVAADANAVWITAHDTATVWRLPLR
jgi:virginiamycin B lyase